MKKNINVSNHEEIDLRDIINELFASKKIIIALTLIITISAFFYFDEKETIYATSAEIAIGNYEAAIEGNRNKFIEVAPDLIDNLNFNLSLKEQLINPDLIFYTDLERNLLKIDILSPSIKKNTTDINHLITYILNRHEKMYFQELQIDFDKYLSDLKKTSNKIDNITEKMFSHETQRNFQIEAGIREYEADLKKTSNKIDNITATDLRHNEQIKIFEEQISLLDNNLKRFNIEDDFASHLKKIELTETKFNYITQINN
jgi:hypothetical protein